MRILLSFPTRLGTRGIGTTVWHQATGLARQGAEVHVICGSVERPMPSVEVAAETMRGFGHRVPYRLVGQERAMRYHDRRAAQMLRARRFEFDVVHAWPGGGERTLLEARALGIPAFLERPNAHTAVGFELVQRECERLGMQLQRSSPHAFNAAKLARETREFAAADALLCPSDFVAATHADEGEAEHRLLRHRYGYDPACFSPPSHRRPLDAALVVAFLGRLEPRKGVHHALEAWRLSGIGRSAKLLLYGPMEPGYDRVLRPLTGQPGVELRRAVSDPASVLREADALVLPSVEEGSALVTYEARACGAVLLVSDCSGAAASHGFDALIHRSGDCETLAEHLRLINSDVAVRERLRANSLAGVGELTWDAAAVELLAAYQRGASRVHGRGATEHVAL